MDALLAQHCINKRYFLRNKVFFLVSPARPEAPPFVPNGGMTAVSSQASAEKRRLRVGKNMNSKRIFRQN